MPLLHKIFGLEVMSKQMEKGDVLNTNFSHAAWGDKTSNGDLQVEFMDD